MRKWGLPLDAVATSANYLTNLYSVADSATGPTAFFPMTPRRALAPSDKRSQSPVAIDPDLSGNKPTGGHITSFPANSPKWSAHDKLCRPP